LAAQAARLVLLLPVRAVVAAGDYMLLLLLGPRWAAAVAGLLFTVRAPMAQQVLLLLIQEVAARVDYLLHLSHAGSLLLEEICLAEVVVA